MVPEISATDAARHFADLLDAVEHRHEHYTVVRRGRVVAHISPMLGGRGADLKELLRERAAIRVGRRSSTICGAC